MTWSPSSPRPLPEPGEKDGPLPRFGRLHRTRRVLAAWSAVAVLAGFGGLTLLGRADRAERSAPPTSSPQAAAVAAPLASLGDRIASRSGGSTVYAASEIGDDPDGAARIGLALLAEVRETGEFALFDRAEVALDRAIELDPEHIEGIVGQGLLALARHDFAGGRRWAERALDAQPDHVEALGLLVDAQLELGEHERAVEAAQRMVDLRPDSASYSRVSYLRELHGDVEGAIEMMALARASARSGSEARAWAGGQLGNLLWRHGRDAEAERVWREVLAQRPGHGSAREGLLRLAIARGETERALPELERMVAEGASTDAAILLGEWMSAAGREAEAAAAYAAARASFEEDRDAGTDVDLALVRFELEHEGRPATEERLRRARAGFERAPSVVAAAQLAWILHLAGRSGEAAERMDHALSLGTIDPRLEHQAGVIAAAVERPCAALRHLRRALALQPAFSLRGAAEARTWIASLEAAGHDCS